MNLKQLPENDGIFFMETTKEKQKFGIFNYCAFESAATQNPERPIRVLINKENRNLTVDSFMKQFENLKFARFDLYGAFDRTALKVFKNL